MNYDSICFLCLKNEHFHGMATTCTRGKRFHLGSIFFFHCLHISSMSWGLLFMEFVNFVRLGAMMFQLNFYVLEYYICIK